MRLIDPRPAARPTALAAALMLAGSLAGCLATAPQNAPASTGAAGGSTSEGADARLQTCAAPVGTVRLQDGSAPAAAPAAPQPTAAAMPGIGGLLSALAGGGLAQPAAAAPATSVSGASLDSMRLLIQQSNCFMIVDRGASESAADDEKRRARTSGEVRDDANMGQGQEVAADYVLRSSVIQLETTGSRGLNLGTISKFFGTASVGQSNTKARVQLVVSDVRTKVQVAVAQGDGAGSNTSLATNLLGRAGGGIGALGASSESKTSGTTILLQAFADAYNKLVPVVQNYKAQTIKGGPGTGGTLSVQGSRADPSGAPR